MDKAFLHDLDFQSPPFTWHHGNLSDRLDRAVGNDDWLDAFPNCSIFHLPRIKSDHRSLLLKLHYDSGGAPNRPFRFLADFRNKIKEWNNCVYGHLSQRKRQLVRKLAKIQHALDLSGSNSLVKQEINVRNKLENILHHEEILLKQKSRCEWLNLGDQNTSYFHRRTVLNRNFNKITVLRNSDGEWIFDPEMLKTEAVNFFQNLYGEIPRPTRSLPSNAFPKLSSKDTKFLGECVTYEEIKTALFDMVPWKAPGSDGFQAAFF
ncbi:hypothetical protein J1N35_018673 [Gossypium stocksii]|uniref:Endonuclease/exonuclease/phosphatase domain-containing protein n=1 Tax=Gossypium stocksii TaxID=47602 RepID=A0A9D3VPK3_9ROSI|nr:hypothetical protein J1N35_018673 [Gossypium stocksii]